MNTTDHTRMRRVVLLFCALLVAGTVMGCGKGFTLEELGATIERDDQGKIVHVDLEGTWNKGLILKIPILKSLLALLGMGRHKITDEDLEHLKGMPKLRTLYLIGTQITDAGLEHLKGFTQLQELVLANTQISDSDVADLQKALPNCFLNR